METSVATAVTALAREYVNEQEEPADYGDAVQNATPKIVPTAQGSVSLGQKHIGCFVIYFLFHVFFTLSSAEPKYYIYSIPLFSFFGKSFFNIFLIFSQKSVYICQNHKIRDRIPYKRHRQDSSKRGVHPPKRGKNVRFPPWG